MIVEELVEALWDEACEHSRCEPGGPYPLILAEDGPTMGDIDTFECWNCPGPDVEHAWNPTSCYSNGGRVYWSPHFKIDAGLHCVALDVCMTLISERSG